MAVKAGFQKLGHHLLHQRWRGKTIDVFQHLQLGLIAPAAHPAHPQAGRDHLGERAAIQHIAAGVERLGRQRPLAAKVELSINIVFNQRDIALGQHLHQGALIGLWHQAAQRVGEVRRQQTGFYLAVAGGQLQRLQRHAAYRVGGDFQRLHAVAFQKLQHAKIGGRFNRHHIAGLRHRAQAQAQRLDTAIGDDDVIHRQPAAPAQRAAGNLPAQTVQPGRLAIIAEQMTMTTQRLAGQLLQLRARKQLGRRHRTAKRASVGNAHITPQQRIHRHQRRLGRGRALRRQRQRRAAAHIKAGLRPRLDQPTVFQHAKRFGDRGQADLTAGAHFAQRRQFIAGAQRAAGDHAGDIVGQMLIKQGGRGGVHGVNQAVKVAHKTRRTQTG